MVDKKYIEEGVAEMRSIVNNLRNREHDRVMEDISSILECVKNGDSRPSYHVNLGYGIAVAVSREFEWAASITSYYFSLSDEMIKLGVTFDLEQENIKFPGDTDNKQYDYFIFLTPKSL